MGQPDEQMMRLTGGNSRRRKLVVPKGKTTRPTSDFLRETLFNILPSMDGRSFVDLFAGSGAVGLEAWSRGAQQVTLVESDRDAQRVIRQNIATLDAGNVVTLLPYPARRAVKTLTKSDRTFDYLFLDPPYHGNALVEIMELLDQRRLDSANGIVVTQHARTTQMPETIGTFTTTDVRQYGSSVLTFYQRAGDAA